MTGQPDPHPVIGLDDVVHQRVRLGILTAGNLSQHLAVLDKAGLVEIEKGYEGKRARTWLSLTRAGDRALQDEVTQLKLLIQQIEQAGPAQES